MRGGGSDRPKATFKPKETKNCLLPPARPHVLRVVEPRPSGVAVLEGRDAARCQRQVKDIAHSSLPILDPELQSERFYRAPTLCCRVRGKRAGGLKMVLCNKCNQGYHIWCLPKPMLDLPEGSWLCPAYSGTYWTHTYVATLKSL